MVFFVGRTGNEKYLSKDEIDEILICEEDTTKKVYFFIIN